MSLDRFWLLFGIPIDEAAFVRRLIDAPDGECSDILAKYDAPGAPAADRLAHIRANMAGYLEWVGHPLAAVAARARDYGVRTIEGATRADLTQAAAQADVLILVSHWKGAEFSNEDFRPGLAEALQSGGWDDPLFHWIDKRMARSGWLRRGVSPRAALRESLHADLGAREAGGGVDGIETVFELAETRAARRRALIDARLAGHVRPGNRLELFDGLWSREAVADAVRGFSGTIDLTTCTSVWLGDHLGAACGHACRTVQFPDTLEPVDAMTRLLSTLDLAAQGMEYLAARDAVARAFGSVVDAWADKGGQHEPV